MRKKKGRARNQEGTYQTLPSGLIRYAQRIGKSRPYGPAKPTRDQAKSAWREKYVEPKRPKTIPTLGSWSFSLINSETGQLNDQKESSTISLDRTIFEIAIKPHPIAKKRLDQITVDDVEEWRRSLKTKERRRIVGGSRRKPIYEIVPPKPMMPNTVARYMSTLRMILGHAVRRGIIEKNPAAGVLPPKHKEETKKIVLTPEQQDEFLKLFEGRLRDIVVFGLHGLRRGEILGLRHEDFDDGGVWVRRQIVEIDGQMVVVPFTKTRKDRWVPLDDEGEKILKRKKRGYVIATEAGTPVWPSNVNRDLKRKIKGTQFEGVHPHDLRSSTAMSLLRAPRSDLRTSAEILGHSPSVLARIYARSNPQTMKEAMKSRKSSSNGSINGGTEAA